MKFACVIGSASARAQSDGGRWPGAAQASAMGEERGRSRFVRLADNG